MTRRVIGDQRRRLHRGRRAPALGDELAELAAARGDAARRIGRRRIGSEQLDVLVNQHVRARSGGHDDRTVGCREHAQRVACDAARLVVESGVERRLAAARQPFWHDDAAPEALEHARHRHPDGRMEFVDETGGEQLGDHRGRRAASAMVAGSGSSASAAATRSDADANGART